MLSLDRWAEQRARRRNNESVIAGERLVEVIDYVNSDRLAPNVPGTRRQHSNNSTVEEEGQNVQNSFARLEK